MYYQLLRYRDLFGSAGFIGSKDGIIDFIGRNVGTDVLGEFFRRCGDFGSPAEIGFDKFRNTQISQSGRQADGVDVVEDRIPFFFRSLFENELGDEAEGDFFTVGCAVGVNLRYGTEAVIDGMGSSQTAADGAEPAEVNAGFDDVFQIFVHFIAVYSFQSLDGMIEEEVIAEFCHGQRRMGAVAPCHGAGTGTPAGAGFKIRSQSIAHAGYEEFARCLGNDACIDEDDVGVADHVDDFDDDAFFIVDDGKAGAGSIVGMMTQGMPPILVATALAVSMAVPPPAPMTISQPAAVPSAMAFSMASMVHWLWNSE